MRIEVRAATGDDAPAIRRVHEQAFGGRPNEADLVEALTRSDGAAISLVATVDGQVVGHVLFSPVSLGPDIPDFCAVGLAPLAVLPEHQRRGIGSSLVREGLEACRAAGYEAVVVLGHPSYYVQFGFKRARDLGLTNEYGADDAFMALELRECALSVSSGMVRYAPAFGETGC